MTLMANEVYMITRLAKLRGIKLSESAVLGLLGSLGGAFVGQTLATLIFVGYGTALALTAVSREEIVNVAWDSVGVTTGPVTVPLLLALGVGLAEAVGAAEGFGILALCSVGPIISVLGFGLWVDRRGRKVSRRVK